MIGPLSFDKTQTGEKLKPVRLIELRSRGRSGRCGRANLLKGNRISADLDWIDATLLENRIASIRQSVSSLRPRPATHNGDESLQHAVTKRPELPEKDAASWDVRVVNPFPTTDGNDLCCNNEHNQTTVDGDGSLSKLQHGRVALGGLIKPIALARPAELVAWACISIPFAR